MKKALSTLLAVCLLTSTSTLAYAAEPVEQYVSVSSYEELVDAIDAADDGDTIQITNTIYLNGLSIETEKHIKLVPADDLKSQMIYVRESGSTISGFQFVDSRKRISTISHFSNSDDATALVISNCSFDGLTQHTGSFITSSGFLSVHLYDCTFSNNAEIAVTMHGKNDIIDNCKFENNMSMLSGAAIVTGSNLNITNSKILNNASGIYNTGVLTMENCEIYGNTLDAESGIDIRNEGTISIDTVSADKAFYNKATGESIPTPMESMADNIWLYCLTEQDAKSLFEKSTDDSGEDSGSTGDSSGEEEQPKEPEQPSDSDKPTPSQPPQESDNSNDHDDTPSKSHKPSHGASAPSTTTNPAPVPKLQCGEAVIDSTRSAKLSGYGDGQLHLEDSLTRAQMAKIIYGLLDENCIEKIGKSDDGFKDVTAEAWFYTAVSALHNAGVVNGVGGGNYNPNDTVTWAQIIAVLSRFVDEEDCTLQNISYNGWAYNAIKTAVSLKWIEDQPNFDADAVINRGEFVELVNHVLSLYRV